MKPSNISVVVVVLARKNILVKPYLRHDLDDAFARAQELGAGEALLFHSEKKLITEGSRSNLLWISKDGVLHWCTHALRGITQKVVLELAAKMGLIVREEQGLDPHEVENVSEIFITKTSTGISPVTEIKMKLEPSAPILWQSPLGPVTAQLMKAFHELTHHYTEAQIDRPLLMGILNLTPDSFSDGGKFTEPGLAMNQIEQLIADGADIIDIGAESTFGPEAQVTAEEEWQRLEKLLRVLTNCRSVQNSIKISIDTYKSTVAAKALELGVDMINDVTALRGDPNMIDVLLQFKPYICLMYSAYDTPYAGRENKQYDDVMATIKDFLKTQTNLLINRGFPREKIIIDPGLGFFLSTDPNVSWEVIDRLGELKALDFPILVGPSMKSFLGGEVNDRLSRSVEAAQKCLQNGASIIRLHNVTAHRKLFEI